MAYCLCILSVSATVYTLDICLKLYSQTLHNSEFSTSVGQVSSQATILLSAKTAHSHEAQDPLPTMLADARTQFFVMVVLEPRLF